MIRLEMKNCYTILTEKQTSALSSGKTDKYEYLTGEEILPSDQKRVTKQTNFIYSPLGEASEKQRKAIEDQAIKQVEALKTLKSKKIENQNQLEDFFQIL